MPKNTNRNDTYQRRRLLPVAFVLIIFAGLWWMYMQSRKPALDPEAKPRAVTARYLECVALDLVQQAQSLQGRRLLAASQMGHSGGARCGAGQSR